MLINWAAALEPLTKSGWYFDPEGKFRIKNCSQIVDTPWLHAPTRIRDEHGKVADCAVLTIYHNFVFMGKGVHSYCLDCYKVVVELETLEQVHKVADWQQGECTDKEWPCKVGAERRNYTQRKWGAYFYCRGVEHGRERYKDVRKWIDENIGEHIKVYLKRACTEFEQNLGDSDKFELVPNQLEIEKEGREKVFGPDLPDGVQTEVIQHHVYDAWDFWESQNRAPVTYHE